MLAGDWRPEVKSCIALDANKAEYWFSFSGSSQYVGVMKLEGTFVGAEFQLTGHGATVRLAQKPNVDISGTNYAKVLSDPSLKATLGMDEACPEVQFLQAVQGPSPRRRKRSTRPTGTFRSSSLRSTSRLHAGRALKALPCNGISRGRIE